MRRSIAVTTLASAVLVGCPDAGISNDRLARRPTAKEPRMTAMRSAPVADGRLELQLELQPGVVRDHVPMRRAVLHFKNVSKEPLRVYLPVGDEFRANISTLIFAPAAAAPLLVPEPRPHGYVVTEKDFHLLAPGASVAFPQRFTVDPVPPGPSNVPRRLPGFEPGEQVPVRWIYENAITRWQGGSQTLDGPTRELFGGEQIPFIWTGRLTVRGTWTAPPR